MLNSTLTFFEEVRGVPVLLSLLVLAWSVRRSPAHRAAALVAARAVRDGGAGARKLQRARTR